MIFCFLSQDDFFVMIFFVFFSSGKVMKFVHAQKYPIAV